MTASSLLSAPPSVVIANGLHAAVVGGSLGGLAAAHALVKNGWNVDVLERSPAPLYHKGSGLGFVDNKSWERLTHQPMMRRGRRAARSQGTYYYGDLWGYLYDNLPMRQNHQQQEQQQEQTATVTMRFGTTIQKIGGTPEAPVVNDKPYDLVVLADGGFSQLRKHVLTNQEEPSYAGYVVWRGSVATSQLSPDLVQSIERSSHSHLEGVYKSKNDDIYDTIALKMAKNNGDDVWMFGTFVATPESELSTCYAWNKKTDGASRHGGISQTNSSNKPVVPSWFLPHMKRHFGRVPFLLDLIEQTIHHGELQPHPQYEFGDIPKVHNGRILLLGDSAHMASPRTAVGAHTAILDALALKDAMKATRNIATSRNNQGQCEGANAVDNALKTYSYAGLRNAQQLYARTRQVSQEFVPNGDLSQIVSPQKLYER